MDLLVDLLGQPHGGYLIVLCVGALLALDVLLTRWRRARWHRRQAEARARRQFARAYERWYRGDIR